VAARAVHGSTHYLHAEVYGSICRSHKLNVVTLFTAKQSQTKFSTISCPKLELKAKIALHIDDNYHQHRRRRRR